MRTKSNYINIFLSVICLALIVFLVYFFVTSLVAYVYPLKYENEIKRYSVEFNIEPEIIASIINTESSFNENAVSSKGAVGLMQVMPSTAEWVSQKLGIKDFSSEDLKIVSVNIRIGTWYYKYLFDKFGSKDVALACYNAGEGVVKSWLNNPTYSIDKVSLISIPYKETASYVKKVNKNIKYYSKKF